LKLFCTILLFFLANIMAAQQVDIDILKAINQQKETNFKNNFFNATANSVTVINLAAPLSLLTAGIIKKDKKLQQHALFMAGGYIVSTIVTQGAKRIIQRERPFNTYSFITKRSEGGGYSMPSGHTSAAFNTATALSLLYPKWYVIAPSFVWASLVGYSRMYQGVHYPSDVVVGALVGSGSAWLAYKAQKWINKKRLKNK
jgi:membrane-associated phospholipid phosphatase